MAAYQDFASVYDLFMDNVDYDRWADYLAGVLGSAGIREGLVLDLACGTGSMTERLAASGYDMIGIDNSAEMLDIAQKKRLESGHDILYLLQDMREFELYGTVRAVVSVCDSINYITEPEDLLQVFRLVNNYLDPGGCFLFDVNTARKYERIGDSTIAESRREGSFIWENQYDGDRQLNACSLTLFLPRGDRGLYEREEEVHLQRAYSIEELKGLLEEAGMEFVWAREAYTNREPDEESDRICILARERGKGCDH